jgi:hypothetical protein
LKKKEIFFKKNKMQTLMFVEKIPWACGFQLTSRTLRYAPKGRIRIARFTTSFYPTNGRGYYGDIYLRAFIRRWKHKTAIHKQRRLERRMAIQALYTRLVDDVICKVAKYL